MLLLREPALNRRASRPDLLPGLEVEMDSGIPEIIDQTRGVN
jgi:hypothetical protein